MGYIGLNPSSQRDVVRYCSESSRQKKRLHFQLYTKKMKMWCHDTASSFYRVSIIVDLLQAI